MNKEQLLPNFLLYLEGVLKVINAEVLNNWSTSKGLLAKTLKPDPIKVLTEQRGFLNPWKRFSILEGI